jgi:hypothetical protein
MCLPNFLQCWWSAGSPPLERIAAVLKGGVHDVRLVVYSSRDLCGKVIVGQIFCFRTHGFGV